MKKLIMSAVMCVALIASASVMAQDTKKSTCSKTKTECTKKDKKACADTQKKDCCTKDKKATNKK